MPRSSRDVVRTAVGLAALAPGLGLIVLAVMLMRDGGASGVLAGIFVGFLAFGLLAVALMMTYAPVTIAKLLEDDEGEEDGTVEPPGPNGGPDGGDDEPLRRP